MNRTGNKFANGAVWQTILSKGSALSFFCIPNQIKSNQIKIFISINNDDNNRYSTYKGNIVMCIIIHLHTFKYIYTHTYY